MLLTIDQNMEFQQNISKLQLCIVVISVPKNQMPYYLERQHQILAAVAQARSGTVIHVSADTPLT